MIEEPVSEEVRVESKSEAGRWGRWVRGLDDLSKWRSLEMGALSCRLL